MSQLPMSQFDEAMRQFDTALRRIESALEARVRAAEAGREEGRARDGLIIDLEAELASLRRDHASLEARTDLVASRLDTAIERIKLTLDT